MKAQYRKLSLVAACVLTLCLMAFLLGWESSQDELSEKARIHPRTCKCPSDPFRKCMCSSEIRKSSTCLHTAGGSDWFDRRFERAIEPLLSEEPMSSDALIWWMNQAPVQGFETDVGNVTTVRIMYPDIASTWDPGAQLLLLPLNVSGLDWFMKALENQDFIWKPRNPGFQMPQLPSGSGQSEDKVSFISLTFLKYVQERWLNLQPLDGNDYFPCLGLVALLYALHTCDQVSLFGFGTDNLLNWSHYWDDKYEFTSDMHSFKSEREIILNLQCEGKVAIYS